MENCLERFSKRAELIEKEFLNLKEVSLDLSVWGTESKNNEEKCRHLQQAIGYHQVYQHIPVENSRRRQKEWKKKWNSSQRIHKVKNISLLIQ